MTIIDIRYTSHRHKLRFLNDLGAQCLAPLQTVLLIYVNTLITVRRTADLAEINLAIYVYHSKTLHRYLYQVLCSLQILHLNQPTFFINSLFKDKQKV